VRRITDRYGRAEDGQENPVPDDQSPRPDRPRDQGNGGRLLLLRHGETEWSRDGRHTGVTDIPLTEHGREQAAALVPLLADLHPRMVLCSPRVRTRDTAELAGLTPFEIDEDLAEWNYGRYEGITTQEIREEQPGWTVWSGPTPGGETPEQISARVDRALQRLDAARAGGDVVAVSHGHAGRVLAARWLGLPPTEGRHLVLGPAAPCLLGHEHGVPAVLRWSLLNPADADPL